VSAPSLESIREAQHVIKGSALRTPLLRLNEPAAPAEIHLKLENLQPIGAFKIRGAAYALSRLSRAELAGGVLTASAGNMALAVAWESARLKVPCTVVAPETAPDAKLDGIRRLGGSVIKVPFDRWWQTFIDRSYPGVDGVFIHAFDDERVMAGNGTIGLEILEDLPDVDAVVVPWGGGGLATGIAVAVKALKPSIRVLAAEVAGAAPLAAALEAGRPAAIDYRPSFVDGIGSKTVMENMLELGRRHLDGSLIVSVEEVAGGLRTLVERNKVVAEGAGAVPVAAALSGRAGAGKVACIVSGGNIDLHKLAVILEGGIP
jgi:threonine dehydratase